MDKYQSGIKNFENFIFILLAILTLTACRHNKQDRLTLGKKFAEEELNSALTDTIKHNVINNSEVIVKDSLSATTIAETILFGIYGKTNITKQRPYEVHHINNFWVLTGTLPKGTLGGTFLIIIDDRNSQIIKIVHGK
jgi:ethanolamine ammonia-lyase small subunit